MKSVIDRLKELERSIKPRPTIRETLAENPEIGECLAELGIMAPKDQENCIFWSTMEKQYMVNELNVVKLLVRLED